jgi:hypothetical protein
MDMDSTQVHLGRVQYRRGHQKGTRCPELLLVTCYMSFVLAVATGSTPSHRRMLLRETCILIKCHAYSAGQTKLQECPVWILSRLGSTNAMLLASDTDPKINKHFTYT